MASSAPPSSSRRRIDWSPVEAWVAAQDPAPTSAATAAQFGLPLGTVLAHFHHRRRVTEGQQAGGGAPAAVYVPLGHLQPWAKNPRRNERSVRPVAQAIIRLGWGNPVLARSADGEVIAGHTRLKAAVWIRGQWAGMDEAAREAAASTWSKDALGLARDEVPVVPVRYLDLDEDAAHAMALADNRLGEIAEWDEDLLGQVLQDIPDPVGLGWSEQELADLLGEATPPARSGGDGEPPVPEVYHEVQSVPGQVYQLGPHRLICGDSTKRSTLDALLVDAGGTVDVVVTDPPFAIYGSSSGLSADITDDKIIRPFFRAVLEQAQAALPMFGCAYICCDWRSWASWWEESKGMRLAPKNMLVWDKGTGLGTNWSNSHELIGYFIKVPGHKLVGGTDKLTGVRPVPSPNVLRFSRVPTADREHTAAKPVELLDHLLTKTAHAETVLDLFGGSGSTLISAARTGKRAFLSEIDPRNCDVIRRRWTRYAAEHQLEAGTGALAEPSP